MAKRFRITFEADGAKPVKWRIDGSLAPETALRKARKLAGVGEIAQRITIDISDLPEAERESVE